jgi:hypothetical protein
MFVVLEAVIEKVSVDSPTFRRRRSSVVIPPSRNVMSKDVGEISISGGFIGSGVAVTVGVGVKVGVMSRMGVGVVVGVKVGVISRMGVGVMDG